jgi:hypothetical protein
MGEKGNYPYSFRKYCLNHENFLKHGGYYDIDGLDTFSIKIRKNILNHPQIDIYFAKTPRRYNL